jgi:transcriptional regulator with XRE-family HTH domain
VTIGVRAVREAGRRCRWYVSLTPSAGPLQFFGAELRRARTAAGLSQDQLGQRLGYSGAQVGKVETGERAPAQDFAEACDRAFPDAGGLFGRIYQLARRWDGGYPSWFAEWIDSERRATSICWWEPLLIPGLLQTADYAGHPNRGSGGDRRAVGRTGRRPAGTAEDLRPVGAADTVGSTG